MGWWNQNAEGVSFAGDGTLMWGDVCADAVGEAVDEVRRQFHTDLGRQPTLAELRAGIEFTIRPLAEELLP